MTSFRFARAALTAAVALSCSAAFAADTASLTVSASVQSKCKLITVPAMSFSLDPSMTGAGTASSVVEYKCTKGAAAPTVTLGPTGGAASPFTGTLTGATIASETMSYSISWSNPAATATGAGFGAAAQTITLNGSIANAQFIDKSAQTFNSPSVTVNLNF